MENFNNSKNLNTDGIFDFDHQPFYAKIPTYIYNFIFELPFENYKVYYKTGLIQKMSVEDKKKLSRNTQRQEILRNFFIRMIKIRPQILDDEDQIHLIEINHSIKIKRIFFIIGLGLNWTYFSFNWMVLKKKKGKLFIGLNLCLFLGLLWVGRIQAREYQKLYEKYKNIIKIDDIEEAIKKIYNIN